MKLAQALMVRADAQKRIAELRVRLKNNAKVQEGDEPAEDPKALFQTLSETIDELEDLITRINQTNSEAADEQGRTLTQLIARRDMLALRCAALREFLDEASARVDRYSNKEVRIVSTIPVAQYQKTADKLSRELRETDAIIQQLNWSTELLG